MPFHKPFSCALAHDPDKKLHGPGAKELPYMSRQWSGGLDKEQHEAPPKMEVPNKISQIVDFG
jgi:hypothetical protein